MTKTIKEARERQYEARDHADATAARPGAHSAPMAAGPRRDRDGMLIDQSLVMTHDQEDALIEGLSEKAADIAWWLLQHYWNWSRQAQVTLRAFAEAAAKVLALDQAPRTASHAEQASARMLVSVLAEQLELTPADIVAAMQAQYP